MTLIDTSDDTGLQRQKDTAGHKSWYKDIVTQGYRGTQITMDTSDDTGIQKQKNTEGHQRWYKFIETQGYRGTQKIKQAFIETWILMETSDNSRI